tara:strand:+ start:5600 stop:6553 length:954 start_codon:yes stop_codon:yes gene_type:complete
MILVTGSAGFIGFHLSLFYLNKNKKVIGIDNLNNYYDVRYKIDRLKILKKYRNFTFIKIDLKDKNSLKKLNKFKNKIKNIVHLAGQAGVRYSIINPTTYIKNNIEAYIYLLEYFKLKKNIRSILYASSSSVYGDVNKKNPNSEKMISVYAVSKKTLEHISSVYNHLYNMNFIGMRFFTVYGPFGRPDMSIFKFFNNIFKNRKIDIYNYGNHSRSFTYVSDIVENIDRLINQTNKNKKKFNEIINIGNPKSIHLMNVVNLIEKKFNKKVKKKYYPLQTGDIIKTEANIKNEQKKYKFKFKVNIKQGIDNFYNWFQNEK